MPGRAKHAFSAGALVMLSIALALLSGEAVVRILKIAPERHPVAYANFQLSDNPILGYELLPNSPDGPHSISNQGLRDQPYSIAKPEGVFRIAVIGDSVTFGLRVDREANYTERLEYLLNTHLGNARTHYDVLNFGVVGYNVTQIAESVRSKVVRYQPDLVIYGYCLNDPQEYSLEMQRLRYLAAHQTRKGVPYLDKLVQQSQLYLLLQHVTNLYTARANAAPETELRAEHDPQFRAMSGNRHVQYFARLHSDQGQGGWWRVEQGIKTIANATSVPVVKVIFPLLDDLQNYQLKPVHDRVAQQFAAAANGAIDLLEAFARLAQTTRRPIGTDTLHPNSDGHWLAAGVIAIHLVRHGFLPDSDESALARISADPQLRALGLAL